MDNPFNPEPHDTGTGYRRYRHARREQRRIRRRNLTLYIMLPVMAAALLISLYNTFVPRKHTLPESTRENMDFLPPGFFESIENASARLDSLVRQFLPDDTLAAEDFLQRMTARFDSLDPKFDLFQDEPGLSTFLNMVGRPKPEGQQRVKQSDR